MSDRPLVTVVIPTRNRLPFLKDAVGSVIAQTYPHWEMIIVDDGSTDGTLESFATLEDPRIRVLSLPHIGHIGQLRNRGIEAGRGEWIAFLDSDDVWLPQKLEVQLTALRESGAEWGYSDVMHVEAQGKPMHMRNYRFRPLSGDIVQELLMLTATVATSTVIVRRSVLDAAGVYSEHPRLPIYEDYELYLRLALCAPTVAITDALVRKRRHPGNTDERLYDQYELKGLIYELFLASHPDPIHARFARRLWTRSLADRGAQFLAARDLRGAAVLFGRSARQGADLTYWTRALARGARDALLRPRHGRRGGIRPSSDG